MGFVDKILDKVLSPGKNKKQKKKRGFKLLSDEEKDDEEDPLKPWKKRFKNFFIGTFSGWLSPVIMVVAVVVVIITLVLSAFSWFSNMFGGSNKDVDDFDQSEIDEKFEQGEFDDIVDVYETIDWSKYLNAIYIIDSGTPQSIFNGHREGEIDYTFEYYTEENMVAKIGQEYPGEKYFLFEFYNETTDTKNEMNMIDFMFTIYAPDCYEAATSNVYFWGSEDETYVEGKVKYSINSNYGTAVYSELGQKCYGDYIYLLIDVNYTTIENVDTGEKDANGNPITEAKEVTYSLSSSYEYWIDDFAASFMIITRTEKGE